MIAAIALSFVVLFLAGFASSWMGARNDKHACEKLATPKGARSVRVGTGDARTCIWLDGSGSTVRVTTLP